MSVTAEQRVGTVLGGTYQIERLLGAGGMGSVFAARHVRLPRRYAVKLLNHDVVKNREIFTRFHREAEIASSIGHENIVQAVDFNYADDGAPYLVLEFLEGEDLAERLARRGRLPLGETLALIGQVAGALAAAHEKGVVHRDLKPSNIYLAVRGARDDVVKVLDFGISKVLSSPEATASGLVMGTASYMSPEQAQGKQSLIDRRTDVFALGAIAWECLAGRRAFDGGETIATAYRVVNDPPPPLGAFAPEVPAPVEAVLGKAMAKKREDRYPTATAFAETLAAAAAGRGAALLAAGTAPAAAAPTVVARPASPRPTRTRHPVASRSPARAAGVVLAVAVAAGGGFAAWKLWPRGERPAAPTVGPSPAPAPVAAPAVPAADASVELVAITLDLDPPGAAVTLDGAPVAGPVLHLPRSSAPRLLAVSAPGYEGQARDLKPIANGRLVVKLARARAGSHAPRAEDPPPPAGAEDGKPRGPSDKDWSLAR